jgi:hypothetical protein
MESKTRDNYEQKFILLPFLWHDLPVDVVNIITKLLYRCDCCGSLEEKKIFCTETAPSHLCCTSGCTVQCSQCKESFCKQHAMNYCESPLIRIKGFHSDNCRCFGWLCTRKACYQQALFLWTRLVGARRAHIPRFKCDTCHKDVCGFCYYAMTEECLNCLNKRTVGGLA